MKNQIKTMGKGFTHEKSLFGISINGWSVEKFSNKTGEVAVALTKNNTIATDERVYKFDSHEKFEKWIDEIYDGLNYQNANLIARAYPVFLGKTAKQEHEENWGITWR